MKRPQFISLTLVMILAACFLVLSSGSASGNREKQVTFARDVAPIVFKNCAECHRPGEVAPMSLLTFKDLRPWAKSIREKVINREMPPWHADARYGQWHNDRRLSQAEVDTIVAWVDGGAKEGDPKDLPAKPQFVEGWRIGQPDETFSIPEQSVPSEGVIAYQYLTVPTNFKEDRWITAAEIRSTGRSAVHHVIVFVQDPGGSGRTDGNLLAGTAPGEQPTQFREGYGKKIPAGSKLIFQMHYTPNGVATKDVTSVGLIYAKQTVKHPVLTRPIMNNRFAIPPGAASHEVKSSFTFQEDAHLVSFMPHMHLRGKDFIYKAVYPDGREQVLLSVPKYDFNWQTYYVPKEPLAIPKGTRIDCVAHFDNSTGNRFNPDPTREVKWGDQTWEEMMIGWASYYNDTPPVAKPAAPAASGQ